MEYHFLKIFDILRNVQSAYIKACEEAGRPCQQARADFFKHMPWSLHHVQSYFISKDVISQIF